MQVKNLKEQKRDNSEPAAMFESPGSFYPFVLLRNHGELEESSAVFFLTTYVG
jgi:hypothetical protein